MNRARMAVVATLAAMVLSTVAAGVGTADDDDPTDPLPIPTPFVCTGAPPYTPTVCIPPS